MMLVDGRRNDDIFIHQLLIFIFTQCGKGNKLIPLCLQLWQYLYNGVSGEVVDIMQKDYGAVMYIAHDILGDDIRIFIAPVQRIQIPQCKIQSGYGAYITV